MKKSFVLICSISILFFSCTDIKSKAKETIKDVGEGVGTGVSELGKGIKEGVEESFHNTLEFNEELKNQGLEFGKLIAENQSYDVYVIFTKDFNDTLISKVFDKDGMEIGRVKVPVEGKKDDAKYISVYFDHPTNIDFDSKLTMEKP